MKRVRILCKNDIAELERAINNFLEYQQSEKVFFNFQTSFDNLGNAFFSCMIIYET